MNMKLIFAFLTAALLSACATQSPREPAGSVDDAKEKAAVLAAMDRTMVAVSNKDHAAMEAGQMPNSMSWIASTDKEGKPVVRSRPNAEWAKPNTSADKYLERYWSPTVLVRGSLAVVWAPYEFWLNGTSHHCGVDVVDFVKVDGVWKVSNLSWTSEMSTCAELRPKDGEAMRP